MSLRLVLRTCQGCGSAYYGGHTCPPPKKECPKCHEVYDRKRFCDLPFAGSDPSKRGRMEDGFGGYLELRNCTCKTTLAWKVSQ